MEQSRNNYNRAGYPRGGRNNGGGRGYNSGGGRGGEDGRGTDGGYYPRGRGGRNRNYPQRYSNQQQEQYGDGRDHRVSGAGSIMEACRNIFSAVFSAVLLRAGVQLFGKSYICTIKYGSELKLSKLQDFSNRNDVVMKANVLPFPKEHIRLRKGRGVEMVSKCQYAGQTSFPKRI